MKNSENTAYFFLLNAEKYSKTVNEIKKEFEKSYLYKNIKKYLSHEDINVKKYNPDVDIVPLHPKKVFFKRIGSG